jgi:hypothetical protein
VTIEDTGFDKLNENGNSNDSGAKPDGETTKKRTSSGNAKKPVAKAKGNKGGKKTVQTRKTTQTRNTKK